MSVATNTTVVNYRRRLFHEQIPSVSSLTQRISGLSSGVTAHPFRCHLNVRFETQKDFLQHPFHTMNVCMSWDTLIEWRRKLQYWVDRIETNAQLSSIWCDSHSSLTSKIRQSNSVGSSSNIIKVEELSRVRTHQIAETNAAWTEFETSSLFSFRLLDIVFQDVFAVKKKDAEEKDWVILDVSWDGEMHALSEWISLAAHQHHRVVKLIQSQEKKKFVDQWMERYVKSREEEKSFHLPITGCAVVSVFDVDNFAKQLQHVQIRLQQIHQPLWTRHVRRIFAWMSLSFECHSPQQLGNFFRNMSQVIDVDVGLLHVTLIDLHEMDWKSIELCGKNQWIAGNSECCFQTDSVPLRPYQKVECLWMGSQFDVFYIPLLDIFKEAKTHHWTLVQNVMVWEMLKTGIYLDKTSKNVWNTSSVSRYLEMKISTQTA